MWMYFIKVSYYGTGYLDWDLRFFLDNWISSLFSREIASAIKKLLDAVNEVSAYIPGTSGKQALDQKKREFVKYSKRFSNTLKEFFRDGQ